MSYTSGIYAIVHRASGQAYIGSSCAIERRWNGHRCGLRKGRSGHQRLQRAWLKYGEDAFDFRIIECVSGADALLVREQHHIDTWQPSVLNCGVVALPPMLGLKRPLSEEAKRKIGDAHRGRPKSLAHRLKLSAAKLGKPNPHTPEHTAKIVAANKRRGPDPRLPMSAETRAKVGAASRCRAVTAETREKMRQVALRRQYSPETRAKMSASAKRRRLREGQDK